MATEEPAVAADSVAVQQPTEPATGKEVPEAKPKKSKKGAASKKPKASPTHPSYSEMITDAIVTLKERNGSSQYAITKAIEEKHKGLPSNFKKTLLVQLKKQVASGSLVKVKGSFKLAPVRVSAIKSATSEPAKSKAPAAKPKSAATKLKAAKPAAKPKAAAAVKAKSKAPAAKPKSAAAKPKAAKPASKPKAAAKAKAAAKPKPAAKASRTSSRTSPGKAKVASRSETSKPKSAAPVKAKAPVKLKVAAPAKEKQEKASRASSRTTPGKVKAVSKKAAVKKMTPVKKSPAKATRKGRK